MEQLPTSLYYNPMLECPELNIVYAIQSILDEPECNIIRQYDALCYDPLMLVWVGVSMLQQEFPVLYNCVSEQPIATFPRFGVVLIIIAYILWRARPALP